MNGCIIRYSFQSKHAFNIINIIFFLFRSIYS